MRFGIACSSLSQARVSGSHTELRLNQKYEGNLPSKPSCLLPALSFLHCDNALATLPCMKSACFSSFSQKTKQMQIGTSRKDVASKPLFAHMKKLMRFTLHYPRGASTRTFTYTRYEHIILKS